MADEDAHQPAPSGASSVPPPATPLWEDIFLMLAAVAFMLGVAAGWLPGGSPSNGAMADGLLDVRYIPGAFLAAALVILLFRRIRRFRRLRGEEPQHPGDSSAVPRAGRDKTAS